MYIFSELWKEPSENLKLEILRTVNERIYPRDFFFSYGSEVIFIIWEQKYYSVKFWQKIIFLPGRLAREISEVASCLQPILSPICPTLEDTIPTSGFKDWEEHFCTVHHSWEMGGKKSQGKGWTGAKVGQITWQLMIQWENKENGKQYKKFQKWKGLLPTAELNEHATFWPSNCAVTCNRWCFMICFQWHLSWAGSTRRVLTAHNLSNNDLSNIYLSK